MKDRLVVVEQLFEHCLGVADPSHSLVNSGRFPDGWVERYLALLEEATRRWKDQPSWPRELVAAIHFASWYLGIRYEAWRGFKKSSNTATADQLATIRTPSEFFLLAALTDATTSDTRHKE